MPEQFAAAELAALLRELKKRKGRSFEALARRLGVSKSALHRYTAGEALPAQFSTLELLARECDASAAERAELRRLWQIAMNDRPAMQDATVGVPVDLPLTTEPPQAPVRASRWWRYLVSAGVVVVGAAVATLYFGASGPPAQSLPGVAVVLAEDGSAHPADIDGDGRAELVHINPVGNVVAYRNRGWSGTDVYEDPDQVVVAAGFTDAARVRFADIDGDGRAEIIDLRPDGRVVAYRNRGWKAAKVYDGPDHLVVAVGFTDASRVRFADIDGDGRAELVNFSPDGRVFAYRNRGWKAAKVYDGPDYLLVVAMGFTDAARARFADIDGDGRAELVNFSPDGRLLAYRNRGPKAATVYNDADHKMLVSAFTDPSRIKFGDVDGDHRAEVLHAAVGGAVTAYRNRGWNANPPFDQAGARLVLRSW